MREWWRAHVSARPSTLILSVIFVLSLFVYFLVRPAPGEPAGRTPDRPGAPTTSSTPTFPRDSSTVPVSSTARTTHPVQGSSSSRASSPAGPTTSTSPPPARSTPTSTPVPTPSASTGTPPAGTPVGSTPPG